MRRGYCLIMSHHCSASVRPRRTSDDSLPPFGNQGQRRLACVARSKRWISTLVKMHC
ncbi:hypothetical protein JI435_412740 [Parastagonospora nodorum SN15]|uniref:Uncharacterized protein n=1 Tax=Phaeosphaeria nodorum (strain SN15 / ATCC MYA-4574 / FGSC 10173) TaxID=321614 RepID=A0A7U2F5J5_PHANO|nr:hypothetical protein JI435_412740 [Parastagonospora nodorum SN15]